MADVKKNKNARKRKDHKMVISAWMLLLPAVIALYLMVWRPSVMGIVWSFYKMKGYTPTKFIGFENYIRVFSDGQFLPVLWNTVQYVFWSFIIGFIPPLAIAFLLNEIVHLRNFLRTAIYLPAILPGITRKSIIDGAYDYSCYIQV
mgnify:CR=1 FL=1